MFYKLTFLICFINIVIGTDINLQTCIENFDIHKDKIIRTQDSRAMGATYLNEIDLDSREECLRLCCETENCDVFVYEEKVSILFIYPLVINISDRKHQIICYELFFSNGVSLLT